MRPWRSNAACIGVARASEDPKPQGSGFLQVVGLPTPFPSLLVDVGVETGHCFPSGFSESLKPRDGLEAAHARFRKQTLQTNKPGRGA